MTIMRETRDDTYVILYADEFKTDIWIQYMNILGLSPTQIVAKVLLKDMVML
jgi:hypothetical protein